MHRFSGEDNPEAPISHHWLDSTHITYGVVTLGYVYDKMKLEGSVFRGREPDENRYNIETGKLDEFLARLTCRGYCVMDASPAQMTARADGEGPPPRVEHDRNQSAASPSLVS